MRTIILWGALAAAVMFGGIGCEDGGGILLARPKG